MSSLEDDPFSASRSQHVYAFQHTLENINSSIEKHDTSWSSDKLERAKRNMIWPFHRSKTQQWISEIDALKGNLTLALSADNLSLMMQTLSQTEDLPCEVREIKDFIEERRALERKLKVDEETRSYLDLFCAVDLLRSFTASSTLSYPGTGRWFLQGQEFHDWLDTPNSGLWVYGIPGAGKTILTSIVLQELQNNLRDGSALAFFFCDYKAPTSQDPWQILGSLVRQLAIHRESTFLIFHEFCKLRVRYGKWTKYPTIEELRELLVSMLATFDTTTIVVDGLDECGTNTETVVHLLKRLGKYCNLLLFSRDEQDIREALAHIPSVSIAAQSSDLRLYVMGEIETRTRNRQLRIRNPELKDQIAKRLIEGAEGM